MTDIAGLTTELTNDPLGRGYNGAGSENAGSGAMTDAEAATSLNATNRDKSAAFSDVLDYLISTRAHTNQGQDTAANNSTPSIILGRLIAVAELVIADEATGLPADPFGAGAVPAEKRVVSTRQLHSAKAFLEMLRSGVLTDAIFANKGTQGDILNDLIGCGIMNTANRTALINLSSAQQSRAEELGLGVVTTATVTTARA